MRRRSLHNDWLIRFEKHPREFRDSVIVGTGKTKRAALLAALDHAHAKGLLR